MTDYHVDIDFYIVCELKKLIWCVKTVLRREVSDERPQKQQKPEPNVLRRSCKNGGSVCTWHHIMRLYYSKHGKLLLRSTTTIKLKIRQG